MFTVPTWWLPSACEWGRWRAGWSPPRSRSTGSSRWSSSGRRSPEHYDTAVWPCHLKLGRRKRRAGVACRGVQHCLSAPRPSPRCFPFFTTLLIKACCKPAPKSQPAKVQRSKLSNFPLEQFAWRIYDCQAHSMEQLVPCISWETELVPELQSPIRHLYLSLSLFARSAPPMYLPLSALRRECTIVLSPPPSTVHTTHLLSTYPYLSALRLKCTIVTFQESCIPATF